MSILILLDDTGLVRLTADQILTSLLDRVAARFEPIYGEPIRRDAESGFGQLLGVLAGAFDEAAQELEAVHSAFNPDAATGTSQDAICAITDTERKPATNSYGTYFATGDNTATLLDGSVVSNQGNDLRYSLADDVTLALATARTTAQVVTAGQVMSSSGGCYYAIAGGTTGAGAGPSGTAVGAQETDGTVTWAYLGQGVAYGSVAIQALSTGPVGGPAFSLSKIGTPTTGWKGGANAEDVLLGSDIEADEVMRVRRLAELHGPGKAAIDAIRSAFTRRSDVSECIVFENVSDVEVDGIGPHGIEAVIDGPISDEDAAQVLLDTVAAGIKTYGTTLVSIADGRGFLHDIRFTRPTEVDVYAQVNVVADRALWPSQPDPDESPMTVGEVEARDAVLAYGEVLALGVNVRHTRVEASVFLAVIPGTLGVELQLDTVAITSQPPADVAISLRQRGKLDTSRTTVVVTYEDP